MRFKSRKPHNGPSKTPNNIEQRIVEVRKATGFSPEQLSNIVNESLDIEVENGRAVAVQQHRHIGKTTAYNILARHHLVEAKKRLVKEYTFFERDSPDELMQADLTRFNGVPLLTMEDDYSKKGWAMRLENELDDTVVASMKKLHCWRNTKI